MTTSTKARLTITAQGDNTFHYAAFRIGQTMPFAQGTLRQPNAKLAKRMAWHRVVLADNPAARPYVGGGTGVA